MTLREGAEFANNLRAMLERYRLTFSNEKELQGHLETIFQEYKLVFWREYELTKTDRPDFYFQGGYVVEVKVGGSLTQHLFQLKRYAEHADVAAVILIGTRPYDMPTTLSKKPCFCLNVTTNRLG